MTHHAQVSVFALACGAVLMVGGLFGIYCQGPFWGSGLVAAMNPDETALALGLPAGVSLAGALLLSYVFLASPLTAHWPPRKRAVVFVVFSSSVLVVCGVAAWFAGHAVSRKLQTTEAPWHQPAAGNAEIASWLRIRPHLAGRRSAPRRYPHAHLVQ